MNWVMSNDPASTDRLVEALATRLRRVDLVGWAQIVRWSEENGLALETVRLAIAFAAAEDESDAGALAELSGFSLNGVYPALHRFIDLGYAREVRRRYSLTDAGRDLVAAIDVAHLAGIRRYVEELPAAERDELQVALGVS
jgi:DNA-binding MarR family transcriptional regulator